MRNKTHTISVALIGFWALADGANAASSLRIGWNTLAAMPVAVNVPAAASTNGIIYVAGGLPRSNNPAASLFAYDPTQNTWTTKASMPDARYLGDGAGVIDGKMYVAGGWTHVPALPHAELFVYDPATDSWSTKASMSHLSGCGGSGVINSKLYVTTACNGFGGYQNLLDAYDPDADSWATLASSSAAHGDPAIGVINGKLYVAGGQDSGGSVSDVVEVYDPATNQWTTKAPMTTGVFAAASTVLSGRLYVFGGKDGSSDIATVQVYDPVSDTWSTSPHPLKVAQEGAVATVEYGIAFMMAGAAGNLAVKRNSAFVVVPSIP